MVFNTTFNNISDISVSLEEETGVLRENHLSAGSHRQKKCCIKYTSPWAEFELTTLLVIGTDCSDM